MNTIVLLYKIAMILAGVLLVSIFPIEIVVGGLPDSNRTKIFLKKTASVFVWTVSIIVFVVTVSFLTIFGLS